MGLTIIFYVAVALLSQVNAEIEDRLMYDPNCPPGMMGMNGMMGGMNGMNSMYGMNGMGGMYPGMMGGRYPMGMNGMMGGMGGMNGMYGMNGMGGMYPGMMGGMNGMYGMNGMGGMYPGMMIRNQKDGAEVASDPNDAEIDQLYKSISDQLVVLNTDAARALDLTTSQDKSGPAKEQMRSNIEKVQEVMKNNLYNSNFQALDRVGNGWAATKYLQTSDILLNSGVPPHVVEKVISNSAVPMKNNFNAASSAVAGNELHSRQKRYAPF